ncbi:MAG TPA: hypothetical protein VK174_14835 [Chitinophagales bacterium]|nr:hypothetical protein [Chitinophagales bacterium]
MITKHLLLPLIVVCFMLEDCNKLSKCKRYVGDYKDREQTLSIKYDGVNFTLEEAGEVIHCTCTDNGTLVINGKAGPVNILLDNTTGKKRFCFEQDSLKEDCIYATVK